MTSVMTIVLGSTVVEEWYKLDLEAVGARILHMEVVAASIQQLETATTM
jgi:hypothetical protein